MKASRALLVGLAVLLGGRVAAFAEQECAVLPIACGQTVTGSISGSECNAGDGLYLDGWSFAGASGQRVTIDLHSSELDPIAFLADSDRLLATDDDSGTRRDSHIEYVLDQAGSWTIAAGNARDSDRGSYNLTLQCAGAKAGCVQDSTTACLLSGRFRARVWYRGVFDNAAVDTNALRKPVTGFANPNFETVFFYFNSVDNIEILLKMLDQGNTNGSGQPTIAVLFGSATPLRTEVTVTDTLTGTVRTYTSPFNTQRGTTDFIAFIK